MVFFKCGAALICWPGNFLKSDTFGFQFDHCYSVSQQSIVVLKFLAVSNAVRPSWSGGFQEQQYQQSATTKATSGFVKNKIKMLKIMRPLINCDTHLNISASYLQEYITIVQESSYRLTCQQYDVSLKIDFEEVCTV